MSPERKISSEKLSLKDRFFRKMNENQQVCSLLIENEKSLSPNLRSFIEWLNENQEVIEEDVAVMHELEGQKPIIFITTDDSDLADNKTIVEEDLLRLTDSPCSYTIYIADKLPSLNKTEIKVAQEISEKVFCNDISPEMIQNWFKKQILNFDEEMNGLFMSYYEFSESIKMSSPQKLIHDRLDEIYKRADDSSYTWVQETDRTGYSMVSRGSCPGGYISHDGKIFDQMIRDDLESFEKNKEVLKKYGQLEYYQDFRKKYYPKSF